jgi:hypothetical protein
MKMFDAVVVVIDAVVDGLGNLIGWVMIGIGAFLLDLYRRFKQLRNDVDDLDRYLTGDDADPDSPGLLEKVDCVNQNQKEMRNEMEQQHQETARKLDQIIDDE